jgi:hypothetical protein
VFHRVEKRIAERVSEFLKVRYGADSEAVLELPKDPRFGELSLVSPSRWPSG